MSRIERIGDATLILGDCLQVLHTLAKVDVVLTDPPYGISLENHAAGKERSNTDWRIENDSSQQVGCAFLDWAASLGLPTLAFASPMKPWPGAWRQHLVWEKGGHVGGGGDPSTCWKPTWELLQVARNKKLNGARDEAVIRIQAEKSDYEWHPTPKPVALISYLVNKATIIGETVLDPFMGSGTTGVACANLGRKFIGIEICEKYFDISCERIDAAYRQQRLFT